MSMSAAVVCGASISGLLAARVLAGVYSSVIVVERDELPHDVSHRPGVPQGHHLHMMLSSGLKIIEGLLPGVTAELGAGGAPAFDTTDPSLAYVEISGHPLCRTGTLSDPDAMLLRLASRPFLESVVRERVRALPNVTFVDGHDVGEPVLSDRAVTGLQVSDRRTGGHRVLPAELVVDATGSAARTPAFLAAHGFARPVEQTYRVQLSYASQLFRVPAGALHEKVAIVSPILDRPTGAGMLTYEDDTVILTLIGVAGRRLPTDLPAILAAATEHLPPQISAVLDKAEPLGNPHQRRYPASVWRRYDKLPSFPKGLLVLGDAVCSLNPVYGQGMTSAALQARALKKVLANTSAAELSQSYFRAAAQKISPFWRANRLNDFGVTPTSGWASWPQRALNRYTNAYMAAASTDIALTETFLRVLQGVDSGATMMHPRRIARVIGGARQGL
ncbi:Putative epoxidase LasC [Mycobacterium simulans]|uniref:Epoxidase LasC n=1 Tax=Mycobacterium simulans TaxID=627089 RepID=A0A7Z7INM6_9MYCO|nr:2-polyprenyl-6-methoxyphenol hydroxylase-like oxidoreductase [Mycobacterium simulans]SOJ56968.1 Putative epoxidase LasC [Mycobacterium simulans]